MRQKVVEGRRAVLMTAGPVLISKILPRPGPTHELHDVLAAAVALSPGPRVALLGFGGGSLVAPLRAMGLDHRIEAVDLDPLGTRLFWRHAHGWAGEIEVQQGDAVAWLRRRRRPFDLILEDLSVTLPDDVVNPSICFDALPELTAARLAPGGIVVVNLLPNPGWSFPALLTYLTRPFASGLDVRFTDAANHFLIAGQAELDARAVSRELRVRLRGIRSRMAEKIEVRGVGGVFR